MSVDLDQTAEWLSGEMTKHKHSASAFEHVIETMPLFNSFSLMIYSFLTPTQKAMNFGPSNVTYPGAVCDKGVNVVFGLVVVKQTTPGQKQVLKLMSKSNTYKPITYTKMTANAAWYSINNIKNRLTCRREQVG